MTIWGTNHAEPGKKKMNLAGTSCHQRWGGDEFCFKQFRPFFGHPARDFSAANPRGRYHHHASSSRGAAAARGGRSAARTTARARELREALPDASGHRQAAGRREPTPSNEASHKHQTGGGSRFSPFEALRVQHEIDASAHRGPHACQGLPIRHGCAACAPRTRDARPTAASGDAPRGSGSGQRANTGEHSHSDDAYSLLSLIHDAHQ